MSRSEFSPGRRSFLAAGCASALGLALLTGCSVGTELRETGERAIGQSSLAPLKAAPPAGIVTVQMLPFTGIPVTIGDGIYQAFRPQAKEAGIELVHRLDDPAQYRIQGHFVAVGNQPSATIVFTYDIFDASGKRVHRIVGQELAKFSEGDPWSSVDDDAQKRLATRAVRAIKAWLTRAPG